ncbi:MAG: hypothetical protein ACRC56_11855 [Bosea sp. (in: a-proteobacteria)]
MPALYNGQPVVGATLTVYRNRTTTLVPLFQDAGLSISALNPQTSNAQGQWQAQSEFLWASSGSVCTVVVQFPASAGGAVYRFDDVMPFGIAGGGILPPAPYLIESCADVRALSSVVVAAHLVCSRNWRTGDGGGSFVLDTSDTVTLDDGGMVLVDVVGRRWKRQWDRREVFADWWDVTPDGLLVNLPTMQAVAAFAGARGVEIALSARRYRFDANAGSLLLENTGFVGSSILDGAGYGTPQTDRGSVIEVVGTAGSPFQFRRGLVLKNLQIFYPDQSPGASVPTVYPYTFDQNVTVGPVQFVLVERVSVLNAYQFMLFDPPDGGIGHVIIRDSFIFALRNAFRITINAERITCSNTTFTPGIWTDAAPGSPTAAVVGGPFDFHRENGDVFEVQRSDGVHFDNVLFFGCRTAFKGTGDIVLLCIWTGVAFDQTQYMIHMTPGSLLAESVITSSTGLAFSSFEPELTGTGIWLEDMVGRTSLTVTGGYFGRTKKSHIAITGPNVTGTVVLNGLTLTGGADGETGSTDETGGPYAPGVHAGLWVDAPQLDLQVAALNVTGRGNLHYDAIRIIRANSLTVTGLVARECRRAVKVFNALSVQVTGSRSIGTVGLQSVELGLVPGPREVAGNLWDKIALDGDAPVQAAHFGVRAGQAAAINTAGLRAAILAAEAAASRTLLLPPGTIQFDGPLRQKGSISVVGFGRGGLDDVAQAAGTTLDYVGPRAAVGIDIRPDTGATAPAIRGGGWRGVALQTSTVTLDRGFSVRSVANTSFEVLVRNIDDIGFYAGVVPAPLGEARDCVVNTFDVIGDQLGGEVTPGGGVVGCGRTLVLDGDGTANTCNNIVRLHATHRINPAMELINADSNDIQYLRLFRGEPQGPGPYGVIHRGGSTLELRSRANSYTGLCEPSWGALFFEGTGPGVAFPTVKNRVLGFNNENPPFLTDAIVVGAGAEVEIVNNEGQRRHGGFVFGPTSAESWDIRRLATSQTLLRVLGSATGNTGLIVNGAVPDLLELQAASSMPDASLSVITKGAAGSFRIVNETPGPSYTTVFEVGTIRTVSARPVALPSYTRASAPSAVTMGFGAMIMVADAVAPAYYGPAWSDGTAGGWVKLTSAGYL